ncbi:MAG: hypothetical protein HKN15_11315 [Xanthomonadales bacterium]|nr:hypothetical protein [Xanthomonadales bacterium]
MKIATMMICSFALASCATPPNLETNQSAGDQNQASAISRDVSQATQLIDDRWPASPDLLPTTDGEIYLGNLNSQINVIRSNPALKQRMTFKVTLASLLYQRFQIEGRVEDAEAARDILEGAHSDPQFGPADHLVFAKILLGFHDFEAAQRHVDMAEAGGSPATSIAAARAALDRALHLPVKGRHRATGVSGNYVDAVQHAAELLNEGRLADASEELQRAQALYRDSSPFPLAWIHVQQGIAFLRYGEYEQARTFFAAAHERFPQYFLATEHLAETEGLLGNHQRSAQLYREVTAQNNQPGFWYGLAQAEAELGNVEAAEDAAQRASSGYADLLARYPLMYADHAVGYYLETSDPARALELATLNFEHRQDLMAHLALAEALMGNEQADKACEHVNAIRDAGYAPPEISLEGDLLACASD